MRVLGSYISFGVLFMALFSCRSNYELFESKQNPRLICPKDFSGIMIPQERLPLFADIDSISFFDNRKETRSSSEMFSLESVLDRDNIKVECYKDFVFEQIPLIMDSLSFRASFGRGEMRPAERAVAIKKYLIQLLDKQFNGVEHYVVTLITDDAYATNHPDFDFLSRPNYTGAIIFSDLNGCIQETHLYKNGYIYKGVPVQDVDSYSSNVIHYLTLFENAQTKSDEWFLPWEGYPSVCIAYVDVIDASICIGSSSGGGHSSGPGTNPGSGPRPGSSPNLDSNSFDDEEPEIRPKEMKYLVQVSTNCPQEIKLTLDEVNSLWGSNFDDPLTIQIAEGASSVTKGEYTDGSYVSVSSLLVSNYVASIEDFSHWTGSFSGKDTDSFVFKVEKDIESTAYYGMLHPCTDSTRRITNPLINMAVASSSTWGNYYGGTFGWTRTKYDAGTNTCLPRKHQGLDIVADTGTLVFAMYSGIIIKAYSDCPDGYVRASYGNEIQVLSEKDGVVFVTQYAHLNYGEPIAINPRTGIPFSVNDVVFQGDLIGYTGRTGNAYDVPNEHLHLGVKVDGQWVNPDAFINGTIDTETINTTEGTIDNIICD